MNKITGSTILITLSVIGLVSSSALLYFDVFSIMKSNKVKGEVVARLASTQNLVQKKRSQELGWEKALGGDELYLKDQVYTYDDAAAELAFDKKSLVKLGANSLLKIEKENDNLSLDFLHGEFLVKISGDSKTQIQSAGETIALARENGRAELLLDQTGGKKNLTVLKGNATLQVGDKQVEVNAGHQLAVDEINQKFEIEELAIILKSPEPKQVLLFNPKNRGELNLSWSSEKDIASFEVILAKDAKFEKIITKKIVAGNVLNIGEIVNVGNFYWKVTAFNKDKTENYKSAVYSFSIKLDQPPMLFQPYAKQEILTTEDNGETYFEWSNLHVEKYELIVSSLENETVLKDIELIENRTFINDLPAGNYAWKVRAIDNKRPNSPFSDIATFSIVNAKDAKPYDLNYTFKLRPTQDIQPDQQVSLNWKYFKKSKNNNFLVEVAEDEAFNKIIFNESINGLFITWNNPPLGDFYWRVTSNGQTSSIANFAHYLKSIDLKTIENVVNPGHFDTIKISWDELERSEVTYQLEIALDQAFTKLVLSESLKNSPFEFRSSEPGTFFVRLKYSFGKAVSQFSPVKSFELVKPSLPPGPKAPELKPEQELEIIEGKVSPINTGEAIHLIFSAPAREGLRATLFKLPEIPVEKKYLIEIYDDHRLKDLMIKTVLEAGQDTYRWTQAIEGTFYLRTAVIDEFGRQSEYSNISKVKVIDPSRIANEQAKKKALEEQERLEKIVAEREAEAEARKARLAEIEKEREASLLRDQTEIKEQDQIKKDEEEYEAFRKSVWLATEFNSLQADLGLEFVSLSSQGNGAGLNESGTLSYYKTTPKATLFLGWNKSWMSAVSFKLSWFQFDIAQVDKTVQKLSFTQWGLNLSQFYFYDKKYIFEARLNLENQIFVDRKLTNGAQNGFVPALGLGADIKFAEAYQGKYAVYAGPTMQYFFTGSGSGFTVKSGTMFGAKVKARKQDFSKGMVFNLELQKISQTTSISTQDDIRVIGEVGYSFGDIF